MRAAGVEGGLKGCPSRRRSSGEITAWVTPEAQRPAVTAVVIDEAVVGREWRASM